MKKRLLITLLVAILTVCALISCDGTGAGQGGVTPNDSWYVYKENVDPVIIYGDNVSRENQNLIYAALRDATGNVPSYDYTGSEVYEHEIVIGQTDRAISRKAYRKLRTAERNDEFSVAYVIYASGNSVAIAYDEEVTGINQDVALQYFIDNYVTGKTELKLNPGVVYMDTYSVLTYCEDIDAEQKAKRWKELEEYIGGDLGKDMVEALQYHYELYDSEMVLWLANLYEPFICHCGNCTPDKLSCGGGGFYYSNSARDNEGYLPDIESTAQALGAISGLGMTYYTGGGYAQNLPTWMKQQLVVFMRSLQDSDGYFRHPQWADEYSKGQYASRLARDLGNAVSVLKSLGYSPVYSTSKGDIGDGGPVIPQEFLTSSLTGGSKVAHVSKVVAASSDIVDWLKDLDSLKAYLDSLYSNQGSLGFYSIGNTITSQMAQIKQQDMYLKTYNTPDSMVKYVIDWFNGHQQRVQDERAAQGLEPNGLWQVETNYNAVNGLLKIIGIYNAAGKPMPYAEEATVAAIAAITSEEKMGAGVDLYNTWFAVNGVLENLNVYCGDAGKVVAAEILANLYTIAPNAIRVSADKMAIFEKADHSFSYTPSTSSASSQGMPAAVPGSVEGDVNGNVIASSGHIANVYASLDIPSSLRVPIFGYTELVIFLHELDSLGPVQKIVAEEIDTYPITFDDETEGSPVESVSAALNSDGSSANIILDPRSGSEGNVLHFVSMPGGGDSVNVHNESITNGNMQVFEGEFCVNSNGTTHTYISQIFIGNDSMLAIKIEGGKVCLYESTTSSNTSSIYTLLGTFEFDQWFKVRVEHYTGTAETVRNKIYVNDVLTAVTDSYYGKDKRGGTAAPKNGKLSSTQIYVMQDYKLSMYLDNLHTFTTNQAYVAPTEGLENLVVNVDAGANTPAD